MADIQSIRLELNYICDIVCTNWGEKAKQDFQECFQLLFQYFLQPSLNDESSVEYLNTVESYINRIKHLNTFYSNPSLLKTNIVNLLEFINFTKMEMGVDRPLNT